MRNHVLEHAALTVPLVSGHAGAREQSRESFASWASMGGPTATDAGLMSLRLLACAVLLCSLFYLAMASSKWYRERFFANDGLEIFLLLFPVIAAALGGMYEAVWKHREGKAMEDGGPTSSSSPAQSLLTTVIHLQFRPLGKFSP